MQLVTESLQLSLPVLELIFVDGVFLFIRHVLVQIITVGIGPLEHIAALYYCQARIAKEFKFCIRVMLDLMQHFYFLLYHWPQLFSKLR